MTEKWFDEKNIGKVTESTFEYTWKDVILYAVGIGAQADELQFVYERNPGGLKVIPSFAAVAGFGAGGIGSVGKINMTRILHGEELIRLKKPLPTSGKITRKGKVTNIYDKGSGAVIKTLIEGYDEKGEHIFDVEMSTFYVGGGGFGGDRGPKAEKLIPPEGVDPLFSISYKTTENQAAIYRLSGDLNPLHIDPNFAKMGGQPKPILHGLSTFGFATRAILYGLCNGEVARFKEFKARFSDVVFPGETLTTEAWKHKDKYIIQVKTDRGAVVLGSAYAIVE